MPSHLTRGRPAPVALLADARCRLASSPILPTSRERRFSMSPRVDVGGFGNGSRGPAAAWRLLEAGRSVAVIERELIGGECAY
jgi:hypothetical protein